MVGRRHFMVIDILRIFFSLWVVLSPCLHGRAVANWTRAGRKRVRRRLEMERGVISLPFKCPTEGEEKGLFPCFCGKCSRGFAARKLKYSTKQQKKPCVKLMQTRKTGVTVSKHYLCSSVPSVFRLCFNHTNTALRIKEDEGER